MNCPYINQCTLRNINYCLNSINRSVSDFTRPNQPLSVTITNIKNSNSEIIENLVIPQFQGAINPVILTHINDNVKNDIMEYKAQLEAAAKEHASFLKLHEKQPDPYQIFTTYLVTYNKNNILSLSIFFQEYLNGKHYNIRTSYNYDLETGNSMSLGTLFRQGVDYMTVLNKMAREQLKSNYPTIAANYKGLAEDQPFYLDNNTLIIYPRFNEIAPVVSDIPLIRIPFTQLGNILKPQFV
jgi:GH15 family glucan-1,4-alpha-glucosidase